MSRRRTAWAPPVILLTMRAAPSPRPLNNCSSRGAKRTRINNGFGRTYLSPQRAPPGTGPLAGSKASSHRVYTVFRIPSVEFGHDLPETTHAVSPTVFRERGYRFFFFSREEPRIHVHVMCGAGEAKYWLEPEIELAKNHQLSRKELREIEEIIEAHLHELKTAWNAHFGG